MPVSDENAPWGGEVGQRELLLDALDLVFGGDDAGGQRGLEGGDCQREVGAQRLQAAEFGVGRVAVGGDHLEELGVLLHALVRQLQDGGERGVVGLVEGVHQRLEAEVDLDAVGGVPGGSGGVCVGEDGEEVDGGGDARGVGDETAQEGLEFREYLDDEID